MRKSFAPTDQILFTSMRYFGKRSLDLPMKILPLDFRYLIRPKKYRRKNSSVVVIILFWISFGSLLFSESCLKFRLLGKGSSEFV